jgi:Plasmid pRiA4b ORF-3-like protein
VTVESDQCRRPTLGAQQFDAATSRCKMRGEGSAGGTTVSTETATTQHIAWEEPNAVRVRVVLEGIEPAIWRRLVVPLKTTLAQFHHILQAAMGWTDSLFDVAKTDKAVRGALRKRRREW